MQMKKHYFVRKKISHLCTESHQTNFNKNHTHDISLKSIIMNLCLFTDEI